MHIHHKGHKNRLIVPDARDDDDKAGDDKPGDRTFLGSSVIGGKRSVTSLDSSLFYFFPKCQVRLSATGPETYPFRDGPVLMKARELYQHFSFVNVTVTPAGPCPLDATDIVTFSYSVDPIETTPD